MSQEENIAKRERFYELSFLISPDFTEEEANNFFQKLTETISAKGGKITKKDNPVRKNLAYQIKKKDNAYLATLEFVLEADKLSKFREELKKKKEILRFIIIKKKAPENKTMPPKPEKAKKREKPSRLAEKKVELNEIDKKLEEIFK